MSHNLIVIGNDESIRGIPCSEEGWEQYQEENLFPCWKCKSWLPWFHYQDSRCDKNSYDNEVDRRNHGHFSCCTLCQDTLCVKLIKE